MSTGCWLCGLAGGRLRSSHRAAGRLLGPVPSMHTDKPTCSGTAEAAGRWWSQRAGEWGPSDTTQRQTGPLVGTRESGLALRRGVAGQGGPGAGFGGGAGRSGAGRCVDDDRLACNRAARAGDGEAHGTNARTWRMTRKREDKGAETAARGSVDHPPRSSLASLHRQHRAKCFFPCLASKDVSRQQWPRGLDAGSLTLTHPPRATRRRHGAALTPGAVWVL